MSAVVAAILIDNMYLQHCTDFFQTGRLDPQKFPHMLLHSNEEHHMTYVFDALPFAPRENATERQLELRTQKKSYLDALEYYERIKVELGYVRPKFTKCYKCNTDFFVPVQKLVDVKLSVRLVSLAWSEVVGKIILVSGDGDLIPAVQAVDGSHAIVRLEYVDEADSNIRTSKGLIRACPEKHKLTKDDFLKAIYKEEPKQAKLA
jgi:uncharacterized LabA/DUF88 family protein